MREETAPATISYAQAGAASHAVRPGYGLVLSRPTAQVRFPVAPPLSDSPIAAVSGPQPDPGAAGITPHLQ